MAPPVKGKTRHQPVAAKPKTKSSQPSPNGRNLWILAAALAGILLITWFIYEPATQYGFTNWDDDVYITKNPIVAHPENTHAMLTTPVGGNYHPLTMYSLAYDYKQTESLPDQQKAHRFHTVNILFHLANILLVFYFIYLLSNKRLWTSLACALFFAIHPMHVESVAWIAERKDVLYAFFFFISLIAYLFYLDKKNYAWLALCFVTFVLSVAAKPAAVILPLVLLAIDYFRSRKLNMLMLGEKIPFFIISAFAGYLTILAQKASGAVSNNANYTLFERLLFPFYGIMMYFVKLVWPFHLSAVYPFPNIAGKPLGVEFYVAPVLVLLAAGTLLWFGRSKRIVAFSLLFFLINVILILQFFNVGQAIIAERYTYVAYLGPFMLLTWWLDEKIPSMQRNLLWVVIGVLSIIFIAQSVQRVKVWSSDETLWTNVIDEFPMRVTDAYNNRGYYYRHAGQPDKALSDYALALTLNPTDELAWGNRGNIFFDRKQFDSAIANYNRSLGYRGNQWETLSNRGASKAQIGDLTGALNDLSRSVQHDSFAVSAVTNLALVYTLLNDHEGAIRCYRRVLQLSPRADDIINAIGVEYQHEQRFAESISEFNHAIQLSPNMGIYYLNRSYSYNGLGNKQNAIQDMQNASRLGVKIPDTYLKELGM